MLGGACEQVGPHLVPVESFIPVADVCQALCQAL